MLGLSVKINCNATFAAKMLTNYNFKQHKSPQNKMNACGNRVSYIYTELGINIKLWRTKLCEKVMKMNNLTKYSSNLSL